MDNIPMLNPDQLSQIVKSYNNGMPYIMLPIGIAKQNGLDALL